MALVSYDVSDASDIEEDDEYSLPVAIERNIVREDTNNKDVNTVNLEKNDVTFCSVLPTPKSRPVIFNSDLSQKLLLNKPTNSNSKKSVKISVPLLSEFEEYLPTPTVKRITQSSKGSGLFALLPPPKNSATFAKEKRLVPDVVRKPPPPKPVAKPSIKLLPKPVLAPVVDVIEEEDEDDDEEVDFLGLNKRPEPVLEPEPYVVPEPVVSAIVPQEEPIVNDEPRDSFMYPPSSDYVPMQSEDIELDDEAMRALCGGSKRRRLNAPQLIDLSDSDVVPDKNEWMVKQLTEDKPLKRQSHKKHSGPSNQQKKKHQITYLAFQAKEQEAELQNQWAANRQTKKQTQSKYGF